MARFEIKSKDGNSIRYSGKPRYNGSYLKPAFVEFSEISSPTPIAWEVGDYLDYSRTGMRYYLYSIPQPSKKARSGANGGSFTYSNVQLFSATKDLEIALFRDLVSNDNNIHFSTSPDVATFENVEGIARRIQACLDDLYPGKWEIRLAEFSADEDAELIESISTAKDFALSGGTCLDALSKIYEMWDNLGWIHSYENGKEVITIGYANKRIDANTTDSYLYGKGNGLTAIKKNQTNKDEFATRLYVYGSERNLPARYYNDKEILNAESVDIRNLMLPLDSWGKTDGLPDARKAYLENAEAVAKFGVIPKTHYFDSEDAGADIYPTIERLTIGEIRSVMQPTDEYYPTDRYTDGDRADAVLDAINPTDDGVLKRDGKEYDAVSYIGIQSVDKKVHVTGGLNNAPIIINHPLFSKVVDTDFSKGKVVADLSQTITIPDRGYTSVSARVEIGDSEEIGYGASYNYKDFVAIKSDDGQNWVIKLGRVSVDYSKTIYDTHKFPVYGFVTIDANTIGAESGEITIKFGAGSGSVGIKRVLDKTFIAYLKQVGFDINTQASLGEGKTISMKTGACAGRNFVISDCLYSSAMDAWLITCKRQQDDTLGMLFPNSSYEIAEGDTFVLLDIAMPELYVSVAQNRLLAEGQKLLSRASKIQSNYEPSIDAKVMVESGRNLREGMFMEISDEDVVDGTTDYILIDSLSIYEDESAIPTYKVTLREKKKVSYKGTPSATSANDTKSVEDETEEQVNVDLSNYVKKDVLAAMWSLDADGNLVTEKQVIVKNNLIVKGDTSSTSQGTDVGGGGILGIKVNGHTYYDKDDGAEDGIIDLGTIGGGGDLSAYITKTEAQNTYLAKSGGTISSPNYAPLTIKREGSASAAISFENSVDGVVGQLGIGGSGYTLGKVPFFSDGGNTYAIIHSGNYAGTTDKRYLQLSGGTINGTIEFNNSAPAIKFYRASGAPYIRFGASSSNEYGELGVSDNGNLVFWSLVSSNVGYNKWNAVIHSGNIGSQTVEAANKLVTSGGADAVIVNSSGNVTFGASDLAGTGTKLYVDGNLDIASLLRFVGNRLILSSTTSYQKIQSYSSTPLVLNPEGNNVGIGKTDPEFTVDIAGSVRMKGTVSAAMSAGAGSLVVMDNTGAMLMFDANDIQSKNSDGVTASKLYINDWGGDLILCGSKKGNVGIGVPSPSAPLHVAGNAIITGDTSTGSDIRFKDKIEDVMLDIKAIADMPLFTFRWNDREDKTIHLGSSAQYWEKHRRELVYGEDFKSLNYPVLGAAGMKTIAIEVMKLRDEEMKELAIEVMKLREEVKQLKRMIQHGNIC